MPNTIDLQVQSTVSDGKISPKELVGIAKSKGLETISITDHDTVDGVSEAIMAGGELGIRIIPGVEMSVEEHGAHVLGYGIDFKNEKLLVELEKFKQGRIEGAKKMVDNLVKNEGFSVSWEDVLREATGSVIARPHIVYAVLHRPENKDKLGGISTVHDFIEKYLSDDGRNYVHRSHILAKDAISLLHEAGGVAVWSHPVVHFPGDHEGLEKFLHDLISWGIEGVEVFNPSHTEDDMEFLNGLAKKYNLIRTAGSDFHDAGSHQRNEHGLHSADTLGDYETYGFSTEDIILKLDEAIAKRKTV